KTRGGASRARPKDRKCAGNDWRQKLFRIATESRDRCETATWFGLQAFRLRRGSRERYVATGDVQGCAARIHLRAKTQVPPHELWRRFFHARFTDAHRVDQITQRSHGGRGNANGFCSGREHGTCIRLAASNSLSGARARNHGSYSFAD